MTGITEMFAEFTDPHLDELWFSIAASQTRHDEINLDPANQNAQRIHAAKWRATHLDEIRAYSRRYRAAKADRDYEAQRRQDPARKAYRREWQARRRLEQRLAA
jgi:hypothetical protein